MVLLYFHGEIVEQNFDWPVLALPLPDFLSLGPKLRSPYCDMNLWGDGVGGDKG